MPQSTVTPDTTARDTAEMRIARNGHSGSIDKDYSLCPSKSPIEWNEFYGAWSQFPKRNNKTTVHSIRLCPYWVRKHFPGLRCMKPGAKPRKVRITMELVD